jgi:two-component system, chemotaxis family, chemotaxis protein CheY
MKILIVDDSKVVRLSAEEMLRELGYSDIVTAEDYEKALASINESAPRLILSDIVMPGKSGIDLLKYVRTTPQLSKIPFIIITTYNKQKFIFEAIRAGVQDYLIKPLEKDVVYEKLLHLSRLHGFEPPKR